VTNRLTTSLSPYLLAHGNNPIEWFPWGEEAFAEAKRRDVPVLVSIGYHTCHWCHVMARESFEDQAVGEVVNSHLVSIKVDREERPDVDSHYMTAAQAFTSHLGWPLNVFVTPDGHPFYAATYLPPEPRGDLPAFVDVVLAVSTAWKERREEVEKSASGLTQSLRVALSHAHTDSTPDIDWDDALQKILSAEDPEYGGFQGSNKFPMAPVINFLLDTAPREDTVALATKTLNVMGTSGLRDAVEGGFFRYATMRDWTVPHFERMLTDNALLLQCYARAGHVDIASGIVSFLREVMAVTGGLASAQHSESVIDGVVVEGDYYQLDATARASVDPPEKDRKVITGWMGLALSGLAHAERAGVEGAVAWAGELAETLLNGHRPAPGILHRVSIDGQISSAPATLEDYGGLALGLLELGITTGQVSRCVVAKELVDECSVAGGGTRLVSASGGDPIIRELSGGQTDVSEGATPSGEALISRAAHLLWALTGDDTYRTLSATTASMGTASVSQHPLGTAGFASALWRLSEPHSAIVVVDDDPGSELRRIAHRVISARATIVTVTRQQAAEWATAGFELLRGRDGESGVAYICQGTVCDVPDRTPQDFLEHLVRLTLIDHHKGDVT
jgi:uncharacterized protein YyaL (SSP411 family)